MPWKVSDVDKHKKGLSPEQKRKWVAIANGVYKECIDGGGNDKSCAPKAIRVANSKFMEEESSVNSKMNIPYSALDFTNTECLAKVVPIKKEDGEEEDCLEMIGYSGKVIPNHWYWGNLGIDVSGMSFPKSKFPILEDHWTDKKIGFTGKPITDEGMIKINPETTTFLNTPESLAFRAAAKQGFPYEASIRAYPKKIERLSEGEEGSLSNGIVVKGPGTIWRTSVFKEVSVCVFGADSNTSTKVFKEGEGEDINVEIINLPKSRIGGKEKMNLEELKQNHGDLVSALTEEIKGTLTVQIQADMEKKFNKEKEDMSTSFDKKVDKLSADMDSLRGENEKLRQENAIRAEKERELESNSIWANALSDTSVPEPLHGEMKSTVSYTKFVKDGVFDREAFTKAVADKVKDWETKFTEIGPVVKGGGTVVRKEAGGKSSTELSKDDEDDVDDMLQRAGHKK